MVATERLGGGYLNYSFAGHKKDKIKTLLNLPMVTNHRFVLL
jgi:hypothetical protein